MSITTCDFNYYESFIKHQGAGHIELDAGAFGMLLTTDTYVPAADTHEFVDDITNELTGNGYARQILTGVTYTDVGPNGKHRFWSNNPQWTASGGSLTAHYWALYYNTPATDATRHLIAYGFLDVTAGGTDVVALDTETLTFLVAATGHFTVGG